MKKTLLGIICFFAYIFSIQAQTLYGTAFNGGNDGGGTINKFMCPRWSSFTHSRCSVVVRLVMSTGITNNKKSPQLRNM